MKDAQPENYLTSKLRPWIQYVTIVFIYQIHALLLPPLFTSRLKSPSLTLEENIAVSKETSRQVSLTHDIRLSNHYKMGSPP